MLAFAQTSVLPEADRVGALSARSCRSANGRNPPVKAPPQHTQAFWEMVLSVPDPPPRPAELTADRAGRQRGPDPALAQLRPATLAVTPRVSLSASDDMLDACAELLGKGSGHLARQRGLAKIATVAGLFPGTRSSGTYARHGWSPGAAYSPTTSTPATPSSRCWRRGRIGRALPDQQLRPGPRLFPLRRHVESESVSRSAPTWAQARACSCQGGAQAYFVQHLLRATGFPLTPRAPAVPGHPQAHSAQPGPPVATSRGKDFERI